MVREFKYQLDPSPEQAEKLDLLLDGYSDLYNVATRYISYMQAVKMKKPNLKDVFRKVCQAKKYYSYSCFSLSYMRVVTESAYRNYWDIMNPSKLRSKNNSMEIFYLKFPRKKSVINISWIKDIPLALPGRIHGRGTFNKITLSKSISGLYTVTLHIKKEKDTDLSTYTDKYAIFKDY